MTLAEVCEEFMRLDEYARRWAEYPDGDGDEWSDNIVCYAMSMRFARHCHSHGLYADLVKGDIDGAHYWVRIDNTNVDWTARQFHNLEFPDNPELQDLPCPMIWDGKLHPVEVIWLGGEELAHEWPLDISPDDGNP